MIDSTERRTRPVATRPAPVPVAVVFAVAVVFVGVLAVHLWALATGSDRTAFVSKWAVVPCVLVWLLLATRPVPRRTPARRLVRLTAVGLVWSWFGDGIPELAEDGFLAMIALFAIAHVAYVLAFAPYHERSILRRPIALAPYAIGVLALVVVCAPGAGALLVPACVYVLLLTATAVLSTGLGPVAGVGGALFLISDAMIALDAFTSSTRPDALSVPIMLTYGLAQACLAVGVATVATRRDDPVRQART